MKMQMSSWTTTLTLAGALLLTAACSSTEMTEVGTPADGTKVESTQSHDSKIEQYSAGDTQYAGFYNNFEYKATILNSQIRDAILQREIKSYQWDREKVTSVRDKANQDAASQTSVFISFFTPDRHNDNLADGKTIWQIFLDAGGHRYQGKAKRDKRLLAELESLYPYHTRWNTAYMIEFPVPVNAIETLSSTLTITGPLGSRTVTFPALR